MIKCLEVDKDGVVYCPLCHYGGILTIEIEELKNGTVHVCDECDSAWIKCDDIFDEKKTMTLDDYLDQNGLGDIVELKPLINKSEYMNFSIIEAMAVRNGIKVMGPMECE